MKRVTEDIPPELVFQPGSSQPAILCTLISIMDDMVVEEDQNKFIVLQTSDDAVTLSPAYARLTIIDDDGMLL